MTTERTDPPVTGTDADILRGFLDYHRDTLRRKVEGLTRAQLDTTLPPSTMTLGGMLKHLAYVEDNWFSVVLHGNEDATPWCDADWQADNDWDWHSAVHDSPEELWALFEESVAASDGLLDAALADAGLDTLSVRRSHHGNRQLSLCWILTHMIEEYARHNGHADLIRESIDGATGD